MNNPTMTRRALIQRGAVGGAVVLGMGAVGGLTAGCNAQDWLNTALKDLPIVVQIAESIISIVGAASGSANPGELATAQSAAAEAKKDLESALQFVKDYQSKNDPGTLGKVDDALIAAQGNLNNILSAFHIKNEALAATLAAALGSAITVVVAIQSLIPAPPAATAARKKLGNPKDQSASIKKAFNQVVDATGGSKFAIS